MSNPMLLTVAAALTPDESPPTIKPAVVASHTAAMPRGPAGPATATEPIIMKIISNVIIAGVYLNQNSQRARFESLQNSKNSDNNVNMLP